MIWAVNCEELKGQMCSTRRTGCGTESIALTYIIRVGRYRECRSPSHD